MRVGLTGGIGSGKSAVARFFSAFGAVIIDADVLAREVVAPGTPGFTDLAAAWPQVITAGDLDRAALARIVFADPAGRAQLNGIIHPRVRERAAEIEASCAPDAIVVHVIPLLFEGEAWRGMDRNVLVVAPRETRIARVMARDGVTRADVEARMAAQIDPQIARSLATDVIDNDGDLVALEIKARTVFDALQAR